MEEKAGSQTRGRRRGAPPKGERISKADIVAAATALVQLHGAQKFTARSLAAKLGTSPMAVYHYFDSKDAILMAVVDELTTDMPRMFTPDRPCRETAHAYARYIRNLAREQPSLVRLLAPWTLTENAIVRIETSLRALQEHGFSAVRAVSLFNEVYAFTVGQAFLDAARPDTASDKFWPIAFDDLAGDKFDGLSLAVEALDASSASVQFERGLDRILDSYDLAPDSDHERREKSADQPGG